MQTLAKEIQPEDTFDKWTVLKELPRRRNPNGSIKRMYLCRCACGIERPVSKQGLTSGNSTSCGSVACRPRFRYRGGRANSASRKCYGQYRLRAEKKGLAFDLTEELFEQISQKPCHYCGTQPKNCFNPKYPNGQPRSPEPFIYNGIDRVDSAQGYNPQNCVPCCQICNRAKSDMPLMEFLQWVAQVHQHTAGLQ